LPGNYASQMQAGLKVLKFRHDYLSSRPYRVQPDRFAWSRPSPPRKLRPADVASDRYRAAARLPTTPL